METTNNGKEAQKFVLLENRDFALDLRDHHFSLLTRTLTLMLKKIRSKG